MARVTLGGIRKSYGDVEVLKGIDLTIEDGEMAVLVGPSGCGKSTLLRCIAGLEEIGSGELTIDGVRANDLAPKDRDIAMVFQSYALYPHMTVGENLGFGLKMRKLARDEIASRVQEAAAMLGLEALLDRLPRQLSGGQRQRVAMGRAIVRRPKVFLFDEPLSNLDATLRVQMRAELARLHRRLGATMIYVTHDQVEAMTLADRIAVLDGGELQQVGSPLELYGAPANRFVAGFIGSPAMNFLAGQVVQNGHGPGLSIGDACLPLAAEGSPPIGARLTVGIRPEHITLTDAGSAPLCGRVEVAEPMGFESHLHIRLRRPESDPAGPVLIARTTAEHGASIEAGRDVGLSLSPGHLRLFDEETGVAIGGARTAP